MKEALDSNGARGEGRQLGLRRWLRIRPGFLLLWASLLGALWWWTTDVPDQSHRGPLPPATAGQDRLEGMLRLHVRELAGSIGPRSPAAPEGLERAARYIEDELRACGHAPVRQTFDVHGQEVSNIEVDLRGTRVPGEIVVVGAHYDGAAHGPAANDNGSGTAALLALAELRGTTPAARTLRFVFFVNEEPPYFQTESMGSLVYARRCRERQENVCAMWSLETLGYYSEEPGSQRYPFPALRLFYPSRGNFVAFVGNAGSRRLLRRSIQLFREHAAFPSEGATLPGAVPGVGWSDHWSFWQCGYPAVMITDTALFRDPNYHTDGDLPDQLDYGRFARVVDGLALALAGLLE